MKKNPYAHKTEHLTKEMLEKDYAELKSVRKVAAKHNLHHKTMSHILTKFGIYFRPKITCTKNENIFLEETEASFYLAGFIAADGNIYRRKNNHNLQISLCKNDLSHLMKLQKILNSNSRIIIRENSSNMNGRIIKSTMAQFAVCSKQIYNDLQNLFCITPNKSLTLKFPKYLSTHPMIHHFIRGYFDGDGSWTIRNPNIKNKQSKINIGFDIVGTKHFIKNVNSILHKHINLPNNKISKNNNIYRLRYSGNRLSSLVGDWLYKDSTVYLERKYDRYIMAKILNKGK